MDRDSVRSAVLVLGGTGFIGRHVVAALRAQGCKVAIGSRAPRRHRHRHAADDWREVRMERLRGAADCDALLQGCSAVVNCVGILRPRGGETYDRVHHRAPAALAAACAERELRLVHVSALGLDANLRSRFLRSKRDGEAALRRSAADWHIVRPSLLDGEGGFGARWIRRVARWPLHPLPRGAIGKLAVLDVRDLGEAIANLVLDPFPLRREHELGGLHARTLGEHFAALRALQTDKPALRIALPDPATRLLAHACDLLHATPLSFGHWELLRHDNCPRENHLPALLGRPPRTVGAARRTAGHDVAMPGHGRPA
jgi:NADH dehydrogenase